MQRTLEQLRNGFLGFSKQTNEDGEILYTSLCEIIVNSEDLLQIADNVPLGQPFPNIMFAAIHLLLLKWYESKLSHYYPTIQHFNTIKKVDSDLEGIFRSFVNKNIIEIVDICKSHRVQTNEIGRCSFVLPGLNFVQSLTKKSLILIEVGTSAGLLLNYDKYTIKYSNGTNVIGNYDGSVTIQCDLIGSHIPNIDSFPEITKKIGIDIKPIKCSNSEESLWLQALVWPRNIQRFESLRKAIEICKTNQSSFKLVKGDGFKDILKYIEEYNELGSSLCIYHLFAMNQISKQDKERYYEDLKLYSKKSGIQIFELTIKWLIDEDPKLILNKIYEGNISTTELARVHHHRRWLEWLLK